MKNLAGLPDRWAVNIEEEAEHPRMGEFKAWHEKNLYPDPWCWPYLGYYCWPDNGIGFEHRHDKLIKGVTLITLDQFFEALDARTAPVITDAVKEVNIIKELEAKGNREAIYSEIKQIMDFFVQDDENVDRLAT